MISGGWTSTGTSAEIVPASEYRDYLTIQLLLAKAGVCLGFGVAAVSGSSLMLVDAGDSVTVRGHLARQAVYAMGDLCEGAYQEGDLSLDITEGAP